MRRNRGWLLLMVVSVMLGGCRPGAEATVEQASAVLPTVAETAVLPTLTLTPLSTKTTPPTNTAVPSATPTSSATPTPTPTFTPTTPPPTIAPETAVDRRCPDPPPLRPAYDRYYLSGQPWPTPDVTLPAEHFWFASPLPGGRFTVNQTYPYGYDGGGRYLLHNGVDAAESLGTPVLAVSDGTVVVAQSDRETLYGWRCDWYGHLVVIRLDETWLGQPIYALYGHVLNINVEVGERVQRGQPVAEVGVGGAANVPHLHFELRFGENLFETTRNPMLWLAPGPARGVIAGRLVDPNGRPWQGVTVTLIKLVEEPEFINTWTYLGDSRGIINADAALAENFLFADVLPGEYELYVKLQGVEYRQQVAVAGGMLSTVEVVTEAYKTPTPAPPADEPDESEN